MLRIKLCLNLDNIYIYIYIYIGNLTVSLSPTLSKNAKVEYHIRMKTHKFIVFRFWVKIGVNPLCMG